MTYVDAHCHPLFAGRELRSSIIKSAADAEAVLDTIREHIAANPEQIWFDLSAISADLKIDRYRLDEVSRDLPIVVHTTDHHSICVNSAALEHAGFSTRPPEVVGGRFEITDGVPNGWIHEYVAMQLIYAVQPKPTLEQDVSDLKAALTILKENQVSEVFDAWIDPGMPEAYFELAENYSLPIKVNLAIRITPENFNEDFEFALNTKLRTLAIASEKLNANYLKIFIDGVYSSNTAWLKSDPDTSGLWEFERLLKIAQRGVEEGFGLHFHACGDAAVSQAIEIVAATGATNAVIAHADQIDPSEIERLRDLKITINTTPVWAENAPARFFDLRAILDAGVNLTFGSDWPVSYPNPKQNIQAAVQFCKLTLAEAEGCARSSINRS